MLLFSKFFKNDSPIRNVFILVSEAIFKMSSLLFIPLSEIKGPYD